MMLGLTKMINDDIIVRTLVPQYEGKYEIHEGRLNVYNKNGVLILTSDKNYSNCDVIIHKLEVFVVHGSSGW